MLKKIFFTFILVTLFYAVVCYLTGRCELFIGKLYYEGEEGVAKGYYVATQDHKKALKWFTRAALKRNKDAKYHLGNMYYLGQGVNKNHNEALKWYTEVAKQGDERSQFHVALMYAKGEGVQKNYDEAIYWFRRRQVTGPWGRPPSDYDDIIGRGQLNVSYAFLKDDEDRLIWLTKCGKAGDIQAYFAVRHFVRIPFNYAKITQQAEAGDAEALFALCTTLPRIPLNKINLLEFLKNRLGIGLNLGCRGEISGYGDPNGFV